MKIMNEYTFSHLLKNKRHTISVAISIIIASALLCSLCIFTYTIWKSKVDETIENTGYWHGELWDYITGDNLKYIIENPEVELAMIKGQWVTAKLPDTERQYLLMRDLDSNYWQNMNMDNSLMDGRLPQEPGEIVISKLFFEDNPTYEIGDEFILPVGNRMLGDEIINTQDEERTGETFIETGNNTYTIVGMVDIAAISAYPGYISMGYLDISQIQQQDELTVYMQMVTPRDIYETLPEIAKSAGLTMDEYGEYGVRYNTTLLNLYGITDQNEIGIGIMVIIIMMITIVFLIMGAFILIIYNAFSLSANSRMKQLGILKSLGATPRQIKYSVLYEGVILCIPLLPIGIIVGYLFSNVLVIKINEILSITEDYNNIEIASSWFVIIFAIIISLVTVIISAYIPARKVAKISSIDAIRQNDNRVKVKKQKAYPIIKKIFGMEGELAIAQFSANKRTYRTAILSLSMCFILLIGYISIISIYNLAILENDEIIYYDMTLDLNITYEPSDEMMKEIFSLPEVKDSSVSRMVSTSTYINSEQESDIFAESGGFSSVNTYKYNVLNIDGEYRIIVNLVGLSESSFEKYCEEIGTDVEKYYEDGIPTGILYDSTYHRPDNSKDIFKIPLLNISRGDELVIWEKRDDAMNTDNNFNIQVGDVTEIFTSNQNMHKYSIALILPMETYLNIVSDFNADRELEYSIMSIDLLVGDEASFQVKEKITEICNQYISSEDFTIWSLEEEKNQQELVQKATEITVFAIALMIGLIGIFNAFSTITNNIKLRRREFAIHRSVGITDNGINKILILEGLFFGITPIFISIPIVIIICWYMLWITLVSWVEFIAVFPIGEVLIYALCIIGTILISYSFSVKSLKKYNLIESIKDETI